METPPWEASKRVARHDYGGVVWQSTQNPRSFLDSVIDSVASSSKAASAIRRTASEPAQSQTSSRRTRSTNNVGSRSASAVAASAPYSVPHSGSLRRRGRRSALATEDPVDESAALVSDVDLDQVASLVGTVAKSLHARPTNSLTKASGSQLARSGSRSSAFTSQPRSATPRVTSLNGVDSSLPVHPPRSTVLVSHTRSLNAIESSDVTLSNAMDVDVHTPRSRMESSNIAPPNAASSLSSQGLRHDGSQRRTRVGQNLLIEANAVPRPSPLPQQLSPIIKKFGTSRVGNLAASKAKNLGMKGTLVSMAASKPFKTPLPAVPRHVPEIVANRSSIHREVVMDSPGNMSSDSLDTSFGIDMDCLEEHLKTYDDG